MGATAVATLDSDTEVTDTPVATTASVRLRLSPRLMLMLRLIPTTDMVTPDLATPASVRLRPSPRLMLMLRLIPTTDTVTPDLATLPLDTAVATTEDSATDTAVATDTLDKKVPALQSAKAFKTSAKQNNYS